MKSYATAFGLAALATRVAGHGYLISPEPRQPGNAMKAACGNQVFGTWSSDINGHIQGAMQGLSRQSDFDEAACNLWLCKGMKLEEGGNVESFTAGQKVPITFNIAAPHTGTANMSVVDTASGSVIGEPLISFDDYASTATGVTEDEKNFDITIPSDLGGKCTKAGDCVLQFWWDARSIDQTYASCIDFTVGGSGAGSGSDNDAPASSAPPASATPSATSPAAEAPSATDTAAAGGNSGSTLPEEFTVQQFITWLKAETGTSASKARRHARAFF